MTTRDEPLIVPPGGGMTIRPGRSVLLAGAGPTGGRLGLLELAMAAGRWVPAHRHREAAEAWYVLEGELAFRFGDRRAPAPAGAFVFVPPGVAHAFGTAGARPARFLELFAPGGSEGYHVERAALERDLPATAGRRYTTLGDEILHALARRFGIEFL